jgi:hypothetical protein
MGTMVGNLVRWSAGKSKARPMALALSKTRDITRRHSEATMTRKQPAPSRATFVSRARSKPASPTFVRNEIHYDTSISTTLSIIN